MLQLGDTRARTIQDVHFHQGPQGHPTPCYDEHCEMPQMSSADIRAAALNNERPRELAHA